MRRLTTDTIEEQIGELDALIDDIIRKPRREITNVICNVPGGCLLEPVVSGEKVFVGFFTVNGALQNLRAQLPDTAKPCTLVIEHTVDNVTTLTSFAISKGTNLLTEPITISAGTRLSAIINTDTPITTALFGYIFVPETV